MHSLTVWFLLPSARGFGCLLVLIRAKAWVQSLFGPYGLHGKFLICSHKAKPGSCSVSLDLYQETGQEPVCQVCWQSGPGPQEGVGHFLDQWALCLSSPPSRSRKGGIVRESHPRPHLAVSSGLAPSPICCVYL